MSSNHNHSRETSWGNFDVLGMLNDIEDARERAAEDLKREKRGNSKIMTVSTTARRATNITKNDAAQRKSQRPPLAGSRVSKSSRTREHRERGVF